MKITKIRISNILGIESLEFKPGKITTISGQNGTGKTSVLEALKAALGGGHSATLLRNGASEGRIVLEFDNGEVLVKKVGREKSKATIQDSEGLEIKQGATYLKEIIDTVGINPVQILTADPKKRIKMLLDSVPMELPVEEIKFITGIDVSEDTRHPLKVIEDKRKDIFDDRAFINAEVKKMRTVVAEMRKTIPFKPDGTDWASEVGRLRGELQGLDNSFKGIIDGTDTVFSDEIQALKKKAQHEIDAIKDRLAGELEHATSERANFIQESNQEYLESADPIKEKITEADQNSKNQASIKGAVDFVEKNLKEIALQEQGASAFTEQLKSLDVLKSELMQNLPVKDLEVIDGDIFIGGIPFDTLNEAARIRFVLMIAGLRKTKLPLVCVDGIEALDKFTQEVLIQEMEKTDSQYFIAEVSESKDLILV